MHPSAPSCRYPTRPISNRSADPDAPYGRCHEGGSAISTKWTLVGGWLPDDFERWDCHAIPSIPRLVADRYDHCVVGIDAHGNGLILGTS